MPESAQAGTPMPSETIKQLLDAVVNGDRDVRAELYATDSVIEMPFAPAGMPALVQGRERLRSQMEAAAGVWEYEKVDDVRLHQTTDPEVVVSEYQVHGRVSATQKPFVFTYIMVSRVVDGLIVSSRDYFNPLDSAEALGRIPEFLQTAARESE